MVAWLKLWMIAAGSVIFVTSFEKTGRSDWLKRPIFFRPYPIRMIRKKQPAFSKTELIFHVPLFMYFLAEIETKFVTVQ